MTVAEAIKRKLSGNTNERVLVVWAREHHIEVVPCEIEPSTQLVRSGEGKLWPKPTFDPKPFGKDLAFLALGEKIVPWPTREKPQYDVTDDGDKIEITPEYLDSLSNNTDTEALLHGAAGMSLEQKLLWLAAGAFIGMVLTYFLQRFIGFASGHIAPSGAGTTVTITNATTNATTLAQSAFGFFGVIWPRRVRARRYVVMVSRPEEDGLQYLASDAAGGGYTVNPQDAKTFDSFEEADDAAHFSMCWEIVHKFDHALGECVCTAPANIEAFVIEREERETRRVRIPTPSLAEAFLDTGLPGPEPEASA